MLVLNRHSVHVDVPKADEQVGGPGEPPSSRGRGRLPLRPLIRAEWMSAAYSRLA
jgi:hypothetical protein